jgi:hypothetical protein
MGLCAANNVRRWVCVPVCLLLVSLPGWAEKLEEEPVTVEMLEGKFQEAMDLRTDGDLYGSIDALNHILTNQPRLSRARLELAVAYYRAARYQQAVAQAQMVLSDPNTPAQVKETVGLFLDQIMSVEEADNARRHTVTGSYGFGAGHDSNINAGPGQDIFPVRGFELILSPGDEQQSDAYANAAISMEHSYRMPGSVDIGVRPVQMFWQSEVGYYRKEYIDEHPFTVDVVNMSTGPALISRTNWRAKMNVAIDWVRLGDNSLAFYTSLNPTHTLVNGKHEFTSSLVWLYREFIQKEYENREGHRYGASFDYGYRFTPTVSMQVGLGGYRQKARVKVEEYDVMEFRMGTYWSAWNGGSVFGRASYEESNYKGQEPVFDTGRMEREHRVMLGLNHAIKSGWLEGWVIDSRITYTDTHANIDIYRFIRKEFSLDINKSF